MTDDINQRTETLKKTLAYLDCAVVLAREQQIAIGKLLAKDIGFTEKTMLQAIKETSLEMLAKNGLDY